MTIAVCSICSLSREYAKRKPNGWKEFGGLTYCPKCWREARVTRAVTLPIAGPTSGTWTDFRPALRAALALSTQAANWIATELYARDYRRDPADEKLPKMAPQYLYPELRARFPGLASQAVATLANDVGLVYRAQRYELLWTGARTLATHRYPYPYPIRAQDWKLWREDETWLVSLSLLSGQRWTLRLRGGPQFHRQIRALEQLADGTARRAAAALYLVTARPGDHRPDGTVPGTRVMLKLVGNFPRLEPGEAAGVLRVRTAADAFLIAENGGREWRLNADHVRGWIAHDSRQRQRLSEDLKAERRSPRRRRHGMVAKMGQRAEHQRNRLKTWIHQSTAMVVNYATRQRVRTIEYVDTERGYLPSFPWFRLKEVLGEKSKAAGIEFVASASVVEETPESLAEEITE